MKKAIFFLTTCIVLISLSLVILTSCETGDQSFAPSPYPKNTVSIDIDTLSIKEVQNVVGVLHRGATTDFPWDWYIDDEDDIHARYLIDQIPNTSLEGHWDAFNKENDTLYDNAKVQFTGTVYGLKVYDEELKKAAASKGVTLYLITTETTTISLRK